ncbi:MAG: hypothetical protein RBS57_00410 [Desulforhabdus sp.]|jgi:hypothetical protein|nr:hypothetical protein [Desulforhabdus sp.]
MPKLVKKTMQMNQEYIDRLREIFGVRTEKEAVNMAMEMALIDDEIIKAHQHMKAEGDIIEEVFR